MKTLSQERLLKVILTPHISEKSTLASSNDHQYVFKVMPDATKTEVKNAIELLFNVKVSAVQVLNVKGKVKRYSRFIGRRKHWKKAYVRLAEGHQIEAVTAQP